MQAYRTGHESLIQRHGDCAWRGWQQKGHASMLFAFSAYLIGIYYWQQLHSYVLPHHHVRVSCPPCVHFQYLLPLVSCMTKHRQQPPTVKSTEVWTSQYRNGQRNYMLSSHL